METSSLSNWPRWPSYTMSQCHRSKLSPRYCSKWRHFIVIPASPTVNYVITPLFKDVIVSIQTDILREVAMAAEIVKRQVNVSLLRDDFMGCKTCGILGDIWYFLHNPCIYYKFIPLWNIISIVFKTDLWFYLWQKYSDFKLLSCP